MDLESQEGGPECTCSASERNREYQKRYYDKLRQDPDRWAAYLEKKRLAYPLAAPVKRQRCVDWKKKNIDKVRAAKRRFHAAHREEANRRRMEHYAAHREEEAIKAKARRSDPVIGEMLRDRRRKNLLAQIARDPEGYRQKRQEYTQKNRAAYHLAGVKKRAQEKNLQFDLDLDWFKERLENGVCEITGIEFVSANKRVPYSASVDRIDPKGPYTKANCRMIIWWLNMAFGNLGEEHAMSVFRAVFAKRGEVVQPPS